MAEELRSCGVGVDAVGRGVVYFVGKLEAGYRACLWSRIASRVILRVGRARVDTPDAVYQFAREINWGDHIAANQTLLVDFVGRGRGITNAVFGAQRVKDAIVDVLRTETGQRPDVDFDRPDVRVSAHLSKGSLTLGIDLSGSALHKRGKGRVAGYAPLKESLAAAMLHAADWPALAKKGVPLMDPMCGSGTFLPGGSGHRSGPRSRARSAAVGVQSLAGAPAGGVGATSEGRPRNGPNEASSGLCISSAGIRTRKRWTPPARTCVSPVD